MPVWSSGPAIRQGGRALAGALTSAALLAAAGVGGLILRSPGGQPS